jgi:ectoine hydroxylase-related dioxygenase (phytanoyl-CoA dioxygenase family)
MTDNYHIDGERRAFELGNRGPIEFNVDGTLRQDIVDAYWRTGFYVFEGVVAGDELDELITEFERVLERAPSSSDSSTDANGRPALGAEFERPSFRFAKPLSDPHGGTPSTHGRYPAKMSEPEPPPDAPAEVIHQMSGILHLGDSFLRLYGHPQLLAIAEQINGPDFTPFTDTIWVKEAGLGASVAWHQDGTTHWDNPDLDPGTHGFNFMMQLYGSNACNALWVVPGTHRVGKIDIKARVEANDGSDRLPDAVPMLCRAGDVAICNRQVLHGSFANTSPAMRATFVFGFHRRASILGVSAWGKEPYDAARIHARSRLIALAVDARQQRFPDEPHYVYQPLADEVEDNRWSDDTREHVLKNYNLNDLGI